MPDNPNAIPAHMRDMTQDDRDAVASALDAIFTHVRDGTGQRLHELLQDEGWYGECEDCRTYLSIDQLGNACLECGHVNGDPSTGSAPDDITMRVCEKCWKNHHHDCEGSAGPDGDENATYCNCARLDHPDVTVERAMYPRLRITYEPGYSHRGFPWILAKVYHPEFPLGNVLNYFQTMPEAHTAATGLRRG